MSSKVTDITILECRKGTVKGVKDHPLKGRLLSLGILKGKSIEIIHTSLFSGAYYVRVGTQTFGLRKEELEQILVS
ncbi:MAG: FeoA family protein [Saprospiraceae bacterium]|nr:FeoA family protein [Saprospiraceae bacterium]